jgi:transposase
MSAILAGAGFPHTRFKIDVAEKRPGSRVPTPHDSPSPAPPSETANQAAKVDAMKGDWPEFCTMRRLAMRFRGMLKSKSVSKLGVWLKDAQQSGLYAMQRFSRTLQRDIEAVRNAITEPWSNGQTEGQINRLKALKRTMYGRAGQNSSVRACFLCSGHCNRK